MNRQYALRWLLAAGLTIAGAALAASNRSSGSKSSSGSRDYNERYSILSDRNIFVRDRSRPRGGSSSGPATTREAPRVPEQSYVLTGVVVEEGRYTAYVENAAGPSIMRLGVGDTVARGVITNIEIDGIEYESSGRRTWVAIGYDLNGGSPVLVPATQSATGTPLPDPNKPNLTIEERMRLRRAQELNRR